MSFLQRLEKKVDAFADAADRATSDSRTFLFALLLVVLWGVSGPHFDYSNRWQLVINTGTTIATFLLGFLIKNNQQRSSALLTDWIRTLYQDHGLLMSQQIDEITMLKKMHRALMLELRIYRAEHRKASRTRNREF